jgi:hypothetical protein
MDIKFFEIASDFSGDLLHAETRLNRFKSLVYSDWPSREIPNHAGIKSAIEVLEAAQIGLREALLDNQTMVHKNLMDRVEESGRQADYEAARAENVMRQYTCAHVKKGTIKVEASSSYGAAQEAAKQWKLRSTAGIDAYLHTGVSDETNS